MFWFTHPPIFSRLTQRGAQLWDLRTTRVVTQLLGHAKSVRALVWITDGMLASAGEDKTIRIWALGKPQELRSLKRHTDMIFSLAVNINRAILASGAWDQTVILWALESLKFAPIRTIQLSANCQSLAFHPNQPSLLAIGLGNGEISVSSI
eukprot:TRINITY_DN4014_c0_g1_i4.p2 TRINITY_DN4014_c0_g1~~TRINITY_DN4014_c0_g1_i4.p2  ORF type:complete len:151 (-),score=32.07 TRINITY_DN4014_c0_g1_i4:500-952(-)